MLYVNKDGFISSFLICMLFISFSSQIALAKTFSTKSNKSDKDIYVCLILILWGTRCVTIKHVSCRLLVGALKHVKGTPFYSSFSESFNHKCVLIFQKAFSVLIDLSTWFFFFSLLIWYITLIYFQA